MSLSLLESMQPLRAAEATNDRVFVYLPNGVNTNDYEMQTAGRDYEFSRILRPFEERR